MTTSALVTITFCLALTLVLKVSANSDSTKDPSNNTTAAAILPKIIQNQTEGATIIAANSTETNRIQPNSEPLEMPLIIETNKTTEIQTLKTSQLLPSQSPRNNPTVLHVDTDQSTVIHVATVANTTDGNHRNLSMSLPDVSSVHPSTVASNNLPQGQSSEAPGLQQRTSILDKVSSQISEPKELQAMMMNDSKEIRTDLKSSTHNVNDVPPLNHGSETDVIPPASTQAAKEDDVFKLQNTTAVPHLLSPSTTPVEDLQLQDVKKTFEETSPVTPVTERIDESVANVGPRVVQTSSETPSTGAIANTTEKDHGPLVTSKGPVESSGDTSNSFVSDFWSTVGPLVILCIGITIVMVYLYHKKCYKRSNEPPQVIVVRDASDWTFRVSGSNRHGSSRRH